MIGRLWLNRNRDVPMAAIGLVIETAECRATSAADVWQRMLATAHNTVKQNPDRLVPYPGIEEAFYSRMNPGTRNYDLSTAYSVDSMGTRYAE